MTRQLRHEADANQATTNYGHADGTQYGSGPRSRLADELRDMWRSPRQHDRRVDAVELLRSCSPSPRERFLAATKDLWRGGRR